MLATSIGRIDADPSSHSTDIWVEHLTFARSVRSRDSAEVVRLSFCKGGVYSYYSYSYFACSGLWCGDALSPSAASDFGRSITELEVYDIRDRVNITSGYRGFDVKRSRANQGQI